MGSAPYRWSSGGESLRIGRCDVCKGRNMAIRWVPDPYWQHEYNESVKLWICKSCYDAKVANL